MCSFGSVIFLLILVNFCHTLNLSYIKSRIPCDERTWKYITNAQKIGENEIFDENLNITYQKGQFVEFIFEEKKKKKKFFFVCPCEVKPCYRKCCKKGSLFKDKCVKSEKSSKYYEELKIYEGKTQLNMSVEENFIELENYICPSGYSRKLEKEKRGDEIFLQKNGSLLYILGGYENLAEPAEFCLEKYDVDNFQELTALICLPGKIPDNTVIRNTYSAFLIIVLPFYLAIFLVYTLIPELRTFHGICLANYSICLFVALLGWIIAYLGDIHGRISCVFLALLSYVFFMASFLWLNSMCIDAWLTFRGRSRYSSLLKREKYLYYSIYVWGLAGLALAIVIFQQFGGPKYFPNSVLPKIAVDSCWFQKGESLGYYFYGPLCIIILTNTALFLATAFNIWRTKRETRKSMGSEGSRHSTCDQQKLLLYVKLFITFGINWSFELIPWLTGTNPPFQALLDIINILYGAIVFILVIFSKNVLSAIKGKLATIPIVKRNTDISSMSPTPSTDSSAF